MNQQTTDQNTSRQFPVGGADARPNWSRGDLRWMYLTVDLLTGLLSALTALLLWNLEAPAPLSMAWLLAHWRWVVILPSGTLGIFAMTGLYMMAGPDDLRSSSMSIFRSLTAFLVLYYTFYFFFSELLSLPRLVVLFYLLVSAPLFVLWRWALIRLSDRNLFRRNLIFLGRPGPNSDVLTLFERNVLTGLQPVGVYPLTPDGAGEGSSEANSEGNLRTLNPDRQLTRYAGRLNVSRIVVDPTRTELTDRHLNDLIDCHRMGVDVTSSLELIEEQSGRYPLAYARTQWERIFPSRDDRSMFTRGLKRALDITGALVGLAVFLPLLPLLAAGIKCTSSGPVFFRQERTGKGGEPFELVKLRTMVENAEEQSGAQWAEENDARITAFGSVLRALHLDEFPQFWHVLIGDMSLVGPRPERPEIEQELAAPNPLFKLRHSVKPGVTGWATIKLEYVDTVEKAERRLEYDLYYMENQSIWLDLHIIFMTCWNMVSLGGR